MVNISIKRASKMVMTVLICERYTNIPFVLLFYFLYPLSVNEEQLNGGKLL